VDSSAGWRRASALAWESHYAAPDPYAGSCGLVVETPQARRRPLTTHGPLRNQHGVFAELLHMAWLLDQPSTAAVLEPHRAARPDAYAAAVRARPLLTNLRTSHASVTAAMDAVTSPNASRSRSRRATPRQTRASARSAARAQAVNATLGQCLGWCREAEVCRGRPFCSAGARWATRPRTGRRAHA
jgi:hypothetical protein